MAKADRATNGSPRAWQRMLSGRRLDLLNPNPLDIEITDIAHGLARVARWNGQTIGDNAYSVAQHSLMVEQLFNLLKPNATAEERLLALLHDAAEFVLGDIISPFKAVMGGNYQLIEERLQQAVHMRFALPAAIAEANHHTIKQADETAAFYEAIELAGFSLQEARRYFNCSVELADPALSAQPTAIIEQAFLTRYMTLESER